MDGITAAVQERMKAEHETEPMNMMFAMNLWSVGYLSIREYGVALARWNLGGLVLRCVEQSSSSGRSRASSTPILPAVVRTSPGHVSDGTCFPVLSSASLDR